MEEMKVLAKEEEFTPITIEIESKEELGYVVYGLLDGLTELGRKYARAQKIDERLKGYYSLWDIYRLSLI